MSGFYARRRIDANQPTIVKALRDAGATVCHLHTLGKGVPDLLVGFRGVNHLLEVKDPTQPLNKQRLTDDEYKFTQEWQGRPVVVVMNPGMALHAIGALP